MVTSQRTPGSHLHLPVTGHQSRVIQARVFEWRTPGTSHWAPVNECWSLGTGHQAQVTRHLAPGTKQHSPGSWLILWSPVTGHQSPVTRHQTVQSLGFIPNLKVGFETRSAIHLYGISDTTEYSQSTTKPYGISTSDNQTISNSDLSFGTNFTFSFEQTQCCSSLSCSGQTSFTTATNVSVIGLETSYSPTRSSSYNHQYDLISFEMVDGHQLLC